MVGHLEKTIFLTSETDSKIPKGGAQSDTFIFRVTAPPFQPSMFDGAGGFNTLIAKKIHQK